MMSAFRHCVACVAVLASGLVVVDASGAAPAQAPDRSIGDPWWDEAVAETAQNDPADEEVEEPAAAEAAMPQAAGRNRIHRRDGTMNILRRELSVVRATCPSLSLEGRRAIVRAGLLAVEQIPRAGVVADRIPAPRQVAPGVVLRVQVGGRAKPSDAAQLVESAIERAVAEGATPDEAQAYRRELEARAERRRAAAVAVLVEAVDQTAMLDDEQRQRLAAALDTKWQPFWDQGALHAGHARMTAARLPPGVAAVVADVLDPEEFKAWQERLRQLPGS
jgi:hypothetical protein